MDETTLLDQAVALALKLSPKERIQLIERVRTSVEHEAEVSSPSDEHWGRDLNTLLDSLDMSDWEAPEFDDPVEWLRQQREKELKQRLGDWGSNE